ncbi:MAG: XRE family transcriptional regulator [Eubacteriales bacterium]|nr:XRE family transcriptional regulator [Eubacteriales bacterium]
MKFKEDIGGVVKEARKSQSVTLRQLSEATGISVGFLSQFERGICNISLDSLSKIAQALDISVDEFFHEDEVKQDKDYQVLRPHEMVPAHVSNSSIQYHLTTNYNSGFLPRIHVLLPQPENPPEEIATYSHAGEEFIYVLEGVLNLYVGDKQDLLYPGDSAYFRSGIAHNWVNLSNKVTRVLSVNYPNPLQNEEGKGLPVEYGTV